MSAPPVRRQGWRLVQMHRLALLAGMWLGSASLSGSESLPPEPDGGPPGPPPAARTPDRPPDRPLPARDPPPPPPDAQRPPRPERPAPKLVSLQLDVPLSDEEFAVRRGLNHVLYRDQRYRLLLDQAQAALSRGDALTAAESLLQVLHAEEDVFLWEEAARRPVSARAAAERRLATMTPAQRDVYERYLTAAAEAALAAALASPRLEDLLRVSQRYPGTPAALRAERCAARLLFDAGRYHESARAWQRVLAEPQRIHLTPHDSLQAALAHSYAGDPGAAAVLLASVADQPLTLGGETRTLGDWHARLASFAAEPRHPLESRQEHWLTPAGSPRGGQPRTASLPYHVPLWSSLAGPPEAGDPATPAVGEESLLHWQLLNGESLSSSAPDQRPTEEAVRQWLQARLAAGEPVLTAVTPLVVSHQVIVRDLEGVVARDLFTGRRLWRYDCETSLAGLAAARESALPDPVAFNQHCAENTLLSTLTSDGERVFLIDHLAESPASPQSPGLPSAEASVEGAPPRLLVNRLVALPLPSPALGRSRTPTPASANFAETSHAPVAVDRAPAGRAWDRRMTPLWMVGGPPGRGGSGAPLEGHFFLGPPLPLGGRLLVLTERAGEICLVVLHAETGSVLLVQGLALVDRPISVDRERSRLAFLPAFVDGLVLCPTPCGVLVAFDLERRTLQWAAQYRNLDTYSTSGWRGDGRGAGTRLPVQPVVCQGHVLLLPPDSGDLYAWRLADGAFAWKTPRRGAHQATVAAADSLLLTSADRLSCISLLTGERRWERSLGPISGQGLVFDGRFLAPLASGALLIVDVATGQALTGGPEILGVAELSADAAMPLLVVSRGEVAASSGGSPPRHVLGNLAATGEWIVSVSPLETAVYVGAEPLRQALRESSLPPANHSSPRDARGALLLSLVQHWSDPQRHLRAAEIALALGDADGALPALLRLVAGTTDDSPEDPLRMTAAAAPPRADQSPWARRAERLLRELLHARLAEAVAFDAVDRAEVWSALNLLASLSRTPEDQARWQLARLQTAAQRRDVETFLATARALSQVPPTLLVPLDVGRTHHLAPAVVIRQSWERLSRELSPQEWDELGIRIRAEWEALAAGDDPAAVERFLRCYDGRPEADLARLARAEWEQRQGRLLAAESHLLAVGGETRPERSAGSVATWTAARTFLAEAWAGRGLDRESRWARHSLAHAGPSPERPWEWQRIPLGAEAEDQSISQVAFRPESPPLAVSATTSPAVTIRLEALPPGEGPDQNLRPSQAEPRRITARDLEPLLEHPRELVRETRSSLRILNLGELPGAPPSGAGEPATRAVGPQVELALVHRETARRLGSIAVPSRAREPLLAHQPAVGHFLPLADAAVYGLSLIDAQLLWTAERPESVAGSTRREERLRLGPSGPGFCTVQTPEGLVCLDPLTGLVRWQRSDVPPDTGLYADEATGLYGDEEVLVLVDADLRTCRVLSTATGEVLHVRQVPIDPRDARRQRTAYGSRLFFVTGARDEPRFRLWDARTDQLLLDVPAHPRLCDDRVNRRVAACLTADHEVLVVETQRGRVLLRHPVPAALTGQITGIRVWRDPDHWYVYLAHGLPLTSGPRYENAATEVKLPAVQVQGTLTVYAAASRQPLWTRSLDNRTLLCDPDLEAPFLAAVSRIREGLGVSTTGLRLEAIDKRTGVVLAERSDVDRVRLVHATHDPAARELSLYGENLRAVFAYGPQQPLLTTDEETTTTR